MSVDSSMLAWIMRLQQTEALVEKRKEDLAGHQQRAAALQADLEHERGLSVSTTQAAALHLWALLRPAHTQRLLLYTQDGAAQELAGLQEQSEALKRCAVQHQKDMAAARQELTASAMDATRCGMLLANQHNPVLVEQACARKVLPVGLVGLLAAAPAAVRTQPAAAGRMHEPGCWLRRTSCSRMWSA